MTNAMQPSTILTVAALSGIPALAALSLALPLHHHRHDLTFTDQGLIRWDPTKETYVRTTHDHRETSSRTASLTGGGVER